MSGLLASGLTYSQAFIGQMEGSLGETSLAACLFGAAMLIYTRIASWRIIVSVFAGMIIPALLFSGGVDAGNPIAEMPWQWHIAVGGFAFGAVFMATDPVSSPTLNVSRFFYGIGIGALCVLVRVVNPAYPEGMMLAVLFMNVFAPLIDYVFVKRSTRRRAARLAAA